MAGLQGRLGIAVAAGVVLAFMGPFGTFEASLLGRVGYWIGLCALWYLLAGFVEAALRPFAARLSPRAGVAALVALTAAGMVAAVGPATTALLGEPTDPDFLIRLYPKVALIGVALTFLSAARRAGPNLMPAEMTAVLPPPSGTALAAREGDLGDLRARLTRAAGGRVLCLEMEDHYVRVHGPRGSTLCLTRMTDAVTALEAQDGLRVHRSWWVAADAVTGLARDGRRLSLRLANGLMAPVSQSYRRDAVRRFASNHAIAA